MDEIPVSEGTGKWEKERGKKKGGKEEERKKKGGRRKGERVWSERAADLGSNKYPAF